MIAKINMTLLDKLFINPTPLDRKKTIFENLHERMFPNKDIFCDFLSTSDASEQLTYAKYILQRLCFESNFPPPYSLLTALLDFENDTPNKSANESYVPQDHFTHIVYTYLLGLYLFFYSPSINKGLTGEFIRKRRETNFNAALDATKDFISFWKYFCLFHDISYPIENAYELSDSSDTDAPSVRVKNQDIYDKYFVFFNRIGNVLSREILLEGSVKYLIIRQLLCDTNNLCFSDALKTLKGEFTQIDKTENTISVNEVKNKFGEYKSIDKIHCFEHFKMLTGFISPEDYIIVLFDALSEQPIAFKYTDHSGSPERYILKSKHVSVSENQIIRYLDHEDYLLDKNFFVRYYFKELAEKTEQLHLSDGSGSVFDKNSYKKILRQVQSFSENRNNHKTIKYFEQITTSSDLNAYMFQCYQSLLSYINKLCPPTEKLPPRSTSLKSRNNRKIIQKYLDDNFKIFFKSTVLDQLPFVNYKNAEQLLTGLGSADTSINADHIDNVVRKAVEQLFDVNKLDSYKKKIKNTMSCKIKDALEKEKEIHGLIVNYLFQCNKLMLSECDFEKYSFFETSGIDFEKFTKCIQENDNLNQHLKALNDYLQNEKKAPFSLEDFIKKYKTKFSVYDHGIWSAYIFFLCRYFYEKIIEQLFTEEDDTSFKSVMSTLCWNVERSKYDHKLKADYGHITYAVFTSIFLHNLYPVEIRNAFDNQSLKWKYDFLKEPCSYFGMMVDALQVWNRRKYYQHSEIDWWPQFSSDHYDITIEQNKIVLHIKYHDNTINQVINKFRDEKDTYLKDFSSFVTIDVIHG